MNFDSLFYNNQSKKAVYFSAMRFFILGIMRLVLLQSSSEMVSYFFANRARHLSLMNCFSITKHALDGFKITFMMFCFCR